MILKERICQRCGHILRLTHKLGSRKSLKCDNCGRCVKKIRANKVL